MHANLWQMLLFAIAGWINEHQQVKLEFALEQLRVYTELTNGKRLWLNDNQRCRLAAKGKKLGFSSLRELVTSVTPETIMRWHREAPYRERQPSYYTAQILDCLLPSRLTFV